MEYENYNDKNETELKEWFKSFTDIYTYNSSFYTKSYKKYLVGDSKFENCRYCGKSKPEITFKKKAHLVPKVIGNQFVFSSYECDDCNQLFGKYETDLANFIGIRGFIMDPVDLGKKKSRIYKSPSGKSELYISKRGIEISDLNNEIFKIHNGGEVYESIVNKYPFVPLNVYKALIKTCLSVLNDEALKDFTETLKFLVTNDFDSNPKVKNFSLVSLISFNDFFIENPIIYICKKKPNIDIKDTNGIVKVPDKSFLIYFKSFCIQIYIPFDKSDNWGIETGKYRILISTVPPIIINASSTEGKLYLRYKHEFKEMYLNEKVRNEKDKFFIVNKSEPLKLTYSPEEHKTLVSKFGLRR